MFQKNWTEKGPVAHPKSAGWMSRLRTDEISDDEVMKAIASVPAHYQYLLQGPQNLSIAGKSFNNAVSIDVEKPVPIAQTLPIAWQGTLSTRTSNTAGILTMANSMHTLTTGAHIDLYYQDAQGNQQFLHDVTVGTVAGVTVPITVPTDSVFPEPDLPAATTTMQAAIFQVFSLTFVGDDMIVLLATCDIAASQMMLIDSTPTENLQILNGPGEAYQWIGLGANPLAGVTPITLWMSHNDINTPRECRLTAGLSS